MCVSCQVMPDVLLLQLLQLPLPAGGLLLDMLVKGHVSSVDLKDQLQ